MSGMLTLWLLPGFLALGVPAAPSAAMMGLVAKQGVHPDVAEQLTEAMVSSLRKTQRFSRVVSAAEIQELVSFESQKQLMSCEASSCLAELGGSLGVDYLVGGTLGRLGGTWLFNVKLINAKTGLGEGSVARPVSGQDEGALINVVDDIVRELLLGMAVIPAPAPVAAPAPEHSPVVLAPAAAPDSSPLPKVLRGLGVALGAAGVGVALGGMLSAAVAGGSLGTAYVTSTRYVEGMARLRIPLAVGFYGGGALAVLGVPMALLALAAGAAGLAGSLFVN